MRVEEIMSTPVVITHRNVKVGHLRQTFARKGINALPVLEKDGTISGIVSSSDVIRCNEDDLFVEDIMSDRVHIALKNNRVQDATGAVVCTDEVSNGVGSVSAGHLDNGIYFLQLKNDANEVVHSARIAISK